MKMALTVSVNFTRPGEDEPNILLAGISKEDFDIRQFSKDKDAAKDLFREESENDPMIQDERFFEILEEKFGYNWELIIPDVEFSI